jgi:hypothetical protein
MTSPRHVVVCGARDRAANVRFYRLAAEILGAVEAGVFPPRVGWHCQDCRVRSRCWAWGHSETEAVVTEAEDVHPE